MPQDLTQARISFNFQTPAPLTQRKQVKELLNYVSRKESQAFETLTYVFCTDEYLLDINRRFLKHDFYTDILTFDLSDVNASSITGEIYISIDRVRENAHSHSSSLKEELLRVILHGALHLCGYKDKKSKDSLAMRAAENKYLRHFHKMFHVKQ